MLPHLFYSPLNSPPDCLTINTYSDLLRIQSAVNRLERSVMNFYKDIIQTFLIEVFKDTAISFPPPARIKRILKGLFDAIYHNFILSEPFDEHRKYYLNALYHLMHFMLKKLLGSVDDTYENLIALLYARYTIPITSISNMFKPVYKPPLKYWSLLWKSLFCFLFF